MPWYQVKIRVGAVLLACVVLLGGCQAAEDRAEKHLENAQELIAAGDTQRAVVELRNVFENVPNHLEARLVFARLLEDTDSPAEAFQQYVLASEQHPDSLEAQLSAARLGVTLGAWDQVIRSGKRAIEIAPDDERAKFIDTAIRYQTAVKDGEAAQRREVLAEFQKIKVDEQFLLIADGISIDNLLRDGEFRKALDQIETALSREPRNERLQQLKLQVLGQLGDDEGIRAQLEQLIALFPENEAYPNTMMQWLISQGDIDSAEELLRARIEGADDEAAQRTVLIRFLLETRGPDAALEEIDAAIESGINNDLFRSLRAGILFDLGDRDQAIAEMEDVIENAEDSEQTNGIKVALARMHSGMGNEVAARRLVEEVLEADPSNVEAIKSRAAWLIEEDRADEAVLALRTALDQTPNDPQLMTLMAEAHLRNGARNLAGEMLALAVEASGSAPAETMRYARVLIADGDLDTAESILLSSLRVVPDNVEVLNMVGRVYIAQQDWSRAQQVEGTLRRLGTEAGDQAADALEIARLQGQERPEEALELLEGMARQSGGVNAATVAAVRTRLGVDDVEGAMSYVDGLLEENPDDPGLKLLKASVFQASGAISEAQEIYRQVLAENPQAEGVWRALYVSKLREGDADAASAILDEALQIMPEAPNLLWARAGELEQGGDVDGAIAIYDGLYERLPNSPVIANNLASLLGTYKEDDAQLERAYTIARRLRGVEVPAFQDTYGWIAFRRGEVAEAIGHLEPAAEGLPNDPMVQFHLAKAYAESERYEEALAQYRKAVEVAGPADTRPQFDEARSEIERIEKIREAGDAN